MQHLIKAIHLLGGTVYLGVVVASFFYILNSYRKQEREIINYAFVCSFFGDGLIAVIIILQYFSATYLVHYYKYSLQIPWIAVAYLAFTLVNILWLFNIIIKYINYRSQEKTMRYKALYCVINSIIILLFFMIIHDAVMQSTYLDMIHL